MTARRVPIWSRVAFIVLLPILAYTIWDHVESRRLDARLTAIAKRNEPEVPLSSRQVADDLQAVRLYKAAAELMTYPPDRSVEARNRLRRAWAQSQWTPETLELARAEIAANREALELVDRAASLALDGFKGPLGATEIEIGSLWQLGRLCELRAAVLANDRKADEALASLAAEARLVRALDLTPDPLRQLMPTFSGLSWVMATVDPSDAARARAERAFADIDHDDRTRRDLFRARGQLLKYGPTWFSGLVPLPLPSWLPTWVPAWFASGRPSKATGPLSSHARVRALDDFDRLLAAAEQPWPRRIDAIIAVSTWPEWPSVFTRASAQELSRRIVEEFARRTAQQVRHIRCARLIVSTMPLDLIDPLTGKPLEGAGCHL